jgi:LacI family transcriptional regulator
MPLTLEDIARMAGVSRSTVSRVINNDPNVNEKTRQSVRKVIDELNFQPNLAARSLAAGQTRILGLVIPVVIGTLFSDPFFPLLLQSIISACNQKDYSIMLWLAEPEYERRTIHQVLYNGLIEGVILSSYKMSDPIIQSLAERKLPFVAVGRNPLRDDISYVDTDNYNGAREATRHLISLGRRRIATITGAMEMVAGLDRLKGYQDELKEAGMPYDPQMVLEGGFTEDAAYDCMQRLILLKPDAVFAASDSMAAAALRCIQEAGLRVPEDISLVGFDDIPLASRTLPQLTTIRQPFADLGGVAVETLAKLIDNPSSGPYRNILPTSLVIRSSCGAVLLPA